MDAGEYKLITSRPDVFRRGDLVATIAVIQSPRLEECVAAVLVGLPVDKPASHTGGPESDYFVVSLSRSLTEDVVEALVDVEAEAAGSETATASRVSSVADLVDLWGRYLRSLESVGA